MKSKFEQFPEEPTPEEAAKIEKERVMSDAELLKGGADFKFDERGERLEATNEQKEEAKKEMERELEKKKLEESIEALKDNIRELENDWKKPGYVSNRESIEKIILSKEDEIRKLEDRVREIDGKYDVEEKAEEKTEEGEKESEKEQEKETPEKEKIFQHQIENISHPKSKNLIEGLALFFESIRKSKADSSDFVFHKDELSNVLYVNDIDYENNKEAKIDEKDKEILEPVLELRKKFDKWNEFSEEKKANIMETLSRHLEDVFGIEIKEPKEGEDFDGKVMYAIKAEKTKDKTLNYKIKKVFSLGLEINNDLYAYYKKWLKEEEQEMKKKWKEAKDKVSDEEFDKVWKKGQDWLKRHQFGKVIKPPRVEVYRYDI